MTETKYSFELFPPKTEQGAEKLKLAVKRLAEKKPEYFSVTFGAGGSTQEGTFETVQMVVEETGIEAAPHLSCITSSRDRIRDQLARYREAGVKRIVALRGDLPATANSSSAPGDLHYANELVTFIREEHGDHFELEVGAYPEMHPQAPDIDSDFDNFRRKVEAGADAAITQYFFNIDAFDDFMERCERAGITIPVIPGIMPIVNFEQIVRFSGACGADIPRWLYYGMERYKDDNEALRDFGHEVVTRLCGKLIERGVPSIHFYTLNQSKPTLKLVEALGLG
ncbi:methylenetetrahydrofolate reductase [NAD(P)H] [Algiphilus sp.]|uniref:methylenetetrahydrofolate reductase [NAD(P)H] n=1 Tax=Algiphilus sp. TaxID=1872431 RepID=UPI0025C54140|nr:methylenetetrahydrofolate reductase [NAD(P)H] [Algiphilus sp.]MCK5771990.1 methylenetetrahydrofolate reductase [NAD(P)H] [Algiphilus sp.]